MHVDRFLNYPITFGGACAWMFEWWVSYLLMKIFRDSERHITTGITYDRTWNTDIIFSEIFKSERQGLRYIWKIVFYTHERCWFWNLIILQQVSIIVIFVMSRTVCYENIMMLNINYLTYHHELGCIFLVAFISHSNWQAVNINNVRRIAVVEGNIALLLW